MPRITCRLEKICFACFASRDPKGRMCECCETDLLSILQDDTWLLLTAISD